MGLLPKIVFSMATVGLFGGFSFVMLGSAGIIDQDTTKIGFSIFYFLLIVSGGAIIVFSAIEAFSKKDNNTLETEKVIDDLKTIVANTTNASSEGDLDSALRLYFEKKSVVGNMVETPN